MLLRAAFALLCFLLIGWSAQPAQAQRGYRRPVREVVVVRPRYHRPRRRVVVVQPRPRPRRNVVRVRL